MLRVGIDCKPLQEGSSGVRTYIGNLLREIASLPNIQLTCFFSSAFRPPDLPAKVHVMPVAGPWINNWVWMEWQLPRAVRQMSNVEDVLQASARPVSSDGLPDTRYPTSDPQPRTPDTRSLTPIDVFHFPAYTASSKLSCRKVVSIHDVSYAAQPQWYPYRGGKLRQRFYRRSAESADAIITMSQFSKEEIIGVYSVEPERVFPIYLASGLEEAVPAAQWERHGNFRNYLLHVGDQHLRRNLLTALEAFQTLAVECDLDFVFIGRDLGARSEIRHRAAVLGCAGRLHFLQDLPLDQMPHWYRHAAALVYPSLYEGFGLPLLEAMQWGCPVVASRAASIPEVAGGNAAWLVDPLNKTQIAEAIAAVLQRPETRASLIARGFERVTRFSWKKTAEQTVAVFRAVLERRHAGAQGRKA